MAKTAEPYEGYDISSLFPTFALPSKWHGWRRLLRPFPILGPRNKLHYTAKSRLALVRSHWSGLTDQQRTDWQTWAAANPPNDGIWDAAFPWTGQLSHAFHNMRLSFIGRPFRDAAPVAAIPESPLLEAYGWVFYGVHDQIFVTWYDVGSDDYTVIVSIRLLDAPGGLKTWLYTIPVAYLDRPERTYAIDFPPGKRCWFALVKVHNGEGTASPPTVYWVDKGEW
jgi:hypothetical protein